MLNISFYTINKQNQREIQFTLSIDTSLDDFFYHLHIRDLMYAPHTLGIKSCYQILSNLAHTLKYLYLHKITYDSIIYENVCTFITIYLKYCLENPFHFISTEL